MKIWIIHQNAYTPDQSASLRHYSLARYLIERGDEVVIVATSFYHKSREEMRLASDEKCKLETVHGVPYLWIRSPRYSGNSPKRLWNMVVFAARVWREVGLERLPAPDIIVGSSPPLFAAFAAEHVSRKRGVPFLFEIRDLWPDVLIEMGGYSRWNPLVLLMRWMELELYRRATRIISILPNARDYFASKGLDGKKVVWVPNGANVDYPLVEPRVRPGQTTTLMYVGAHSLYSGLDVVIDAADILEREVRALPVTFRLIGDGPEKPRLKDKARHLGLKSVTFEDPVPHSTLPDTLREADGFLMVYKDAPLLRWGLCPNKLYDYMAAGRPLLFGMRIPNNPVKILGAGVEFEPENPRALANAIQKFLKIPATERTAMGRRAREYVELHHAFPVIGERLREVLEEVVASTA